MSPPLCLPPLQWMQFAGGNQLPGEEGLAGSQAAGRVVGSLPNQ
jgi:hypothetical protein